MLRGIRMKCFSRKVQIVAYYNLDGEYLLFEENPLHGKTFQNVNVSFSQDVRTICGISFAVDIVAIEGCDPIECELVGYRTSAEGTLVISVCQDWG